jgi:hypothetical protein
MPEHRLVATRNFTVRAKSSDPELDPRIISFILHRINLSVQLYLKRWLTEYGLEEIQVQWNPADNSTSNNINSSCNTAASPGMPSLSPYASSYARTVRIPNNRELVEELDSRQRAVQPNVEEISTAPSIDWDAYVRLADESGELERARATPPNMRTYSEDALFTAVLREGEVALDALEAEIALDLETVSSENAALVVPSREERQRLFQRGFNRRPRVGTTTESIDRVEFEELHGDTEPN